MVVEEHHEPKNAVWHIENDGTSLTRPQTGQSHCSRVDDCLQSVATRDTHAASDGGGGGGDDDGGGDTDTKYDDVSTL